MPSHVATRLSSVTAAALSVFSVMVTSLGRGKALCPPSPKERQGPRGGAARPCGRDAAPTSRAGRQGAGRGACSLCQRLGRGKAWRCRRGSAANFYTDPARGRPPLPRRPGAFDDREDRGCRRCPRRSGCRKGTSGPMSPHSRGSVGTDLQLTQRLARTVRMTLPRREAASRMGVRLGRLGEPP